MAIDKRNPVDRKEFKEMADTLGIEVPGNATTAKAGLVKQAAFQADSAAADVPGLVSDFNALLALLVAAGIMAGS